MKKGEIRLVEIPASNGHEQSGLRPVHNKIESHTERKTP